MKRILWLGLALWLTGWGAAGEEVRWGGRLGPAARGRGFAQEGWLVCRGAAWSR